MYTWRHTQWQKWEEGLENAALVLLSAWTSMDSAHKFTETVGGLDRIIAFFACLRALKRPRMAGGCLCMAVTAGYSSEERHPEFPQRGRRPCFIHDGPLQIGSYIASGAPGKLLFVVTPPRDFSPPWSFLCCLGTCSLLWLGMRVYGFWFL